MRNKNNKNTLSEIVFVLMSITFVVMLCSFIKGLFIPDDGINNEVLWKISITPMIGALVGVIYLKKEVRSLIRWTTLITLLLGLSLSFFSINGNGYPSFDEAIVSVALFGLSNIIFIFKNGFDD